MLRSDEAIDLHSASKSCSAIMQSFKTSRRLIHAIRRVLALNQDCGNVMSGYSRMLNAGVENRLSARSSKTDNRNLIIAAGGLFFFTIALLVRSNGQFAVAET